MVALVQASLNLPVVLLSLIAGAMADNLDRRKVMIGAQIFMLVVSVALMLCTWSGLITTLAAAAIHLCDRMRRGIQRSGMAGICRRHGAACGVGGRSKLSTAWASTLPASGGPRHWRAHRRGSRSRRRVRSECGQLYRADRRTGALAPTAASARTPS
jgi:MFS family permease